MFSLVSARYERASLIVTSNEPFGAWGEIFGDEVTAVAMIDRLVHLAQTRRTATQRPHNTARQHQRAKPPTPT